MTAVRGTASLVRLALRRDRVMLPVWTAVFVITAAFSASATGSLYPTEADRVKAAQAFGTPSLVALYGRIYDVHSEGALALIKTGGLGAIFIALVSILTVVRHTRADEETGRMEMVGATAIGRSAPLTAALVVAIGTNLVIGLLTALGLIAGGLPAAGSVAFGLAWAGVGTAFAAIAAVVAQLAGTARAATSTCVAILGVVYVLRAIGDLSDRGGPRWLTWLSPIGWGQQFRPYAGNRWWVLLITVGFAVVTVTLAYGLVARRDMGAGLLPQRPGPAGAGRTLGSPLALAWRLQRGQLLAWSVGFLVLGLLFGNLATNLSGFLNNQQARDLFSRLGGGQAQLTHAYLAACLGILGTAAAAYGIQAAQRLRGEESSLRVEPLLATAVGRTRWVLSHTVIALLGSALLMVVAGAGAGLIYGAHVHDSGETARVLAGGLAQIPATWVLTGLVVAGFGRLPRIAAVGWAFLVIFVVLGEIGPLLRLNHWVMDASPFTHVPKLPGGTVHSVPIIVLLLVAAGLIGLGLSTFRRRDVPAT